MDLLVVPLSESFEELWPQLAQDLGATLRVWAPEDPDPAAGGPTAAVVVAAGGTEHQALAWLAAHAARDAVPVFVVGAEPGRRTALQVLSAGATDYLVMPDDVELLRSALRTALARHAEAARRHPRPGAGDHPFGAIMGQSPALKAALDRAARVLPHGAATVLINGETGTGKELLARAIHDGGPRRSGAFVTINCSALPAHLIESELFGHERGAFTDAHATKQGLFAVADGGTLLLDEVDSLPLPLQAKLLRVLEDKTVRRVGGTRTRTLDLRIIAATHADLREAVAAGQFREDLYFRLSVITLTLPALRERGDDVILIARAMLERLAAQFGVPVPPLDAAAERAFRGHSWPGNVRELRNAVERALLLSAPGTLDVAELLPGRTAPERDEPVASAATLDQLAAAAARAALRRCNGNRSEAARRLNVSRQRLRRLLNEPLGLPA